MSSETWIDKLATINEALQLDFDEMMEIPDEILESFGTHLQQAGFHEDIVDSFVNLTPQGKKDFIQSIYRLSNPDQRNPEYRRKLYAHIARHYEQFFNWEELGEAGWGGIPFP